MTTGLPAQRRTSASASLGRGLDIDGRSPGDRELATLLTESAHDEDDERDRDRRVDHVVDVAEVLVEQLVLGAERGADADEGCVPDAAADDRVDAESREAHARGAGGDRDEAADARDEAPDEHRPRPASGEPVGAPFEVGAAHEPGARDEVDARRMPTAAPSQ